MSVKHIAWVWEHSRAEGGALLVALALADSVNHLDESDECWPKREVLARRVRLSESQVSRCLAELETLGEIVRTRTQQGNRYKLLMPDVRICDERTHATSDDAPMRHPDDAPMRHPYVEPEVEPEKNRNNAGAQASMLPDPVEETWQLYVELMKRPRAKLDRKVRKWIADAHAAVGVDQTRQAIRGLAASDYHRQNGYIGIEYAIKPKRDETIEGRISAMAARVGDRTVPNGQTTVDQLIARLPSEARSMVRSWMADVEAMLRSPDHAGIVATGQGSLNDLRTKARMEPIIEDGKITDWRDLR
jgi:hypothetical protein